MYWVIFVYFSLKYCLKHCSSRFNTILKADVYQIIQSNWFYVHIIFQGVRGCIKIKSMNLTNIQRDVTFAPHIITYVVSYRRSIEIWRVCKIYGRRGGAEPSILFTNPPYFYRLSGTDNISVLFRRGPWIEYAVTKIGNKQHRLHTYAAEFCARKCDVTTCADDVIDDAVKNQRRHDVLPLLK